MADRQVVFRPNFTTKSLDYSESSLRIALDCLSKSLITEQCSDTIDRVIGLNEVMLSDGINTHFRIYQESRYDLTGKTDPDMVLVVNGKFEKDSFVMIGVVPDIADQTGDNINVQLLFKNDANKTKQLPRDFFESPKAIFSAFMNLSYIVGTTFPGLDSEISISEVGTNHGRVLVVDRNGDGIRDIIIDTGGAKEKNGRYLEFLSENITP